MLYFQYLQFLDAGSATILELALVMYPRYNIHSHHTCQVVVQINQMPHCSGVY